MYKGHKIIDGHIHYMLDLEPDALVKFMDETGMDAANLASISHGTRLSCTLDALTLKALYPGRFYVCGSLDPCEYYRGGEDMGARLASYARRLISCGCDGIKLLEGKPQLRRALPVPDFDAKCWEAFWTFMEETQTPLLWHVNDPEEFWDKSKIPLWAAKLGWEYDDTYINNEAQYAQVLTVLEHHPKLRVTFAHMFFLSAQLSRLSAILDRFANVMVDLTPGIEMYENLSRDAHETRSFFEKYHDRIIYGTSPIDVWELRGVDGMLRDYAPNYNGLLCEYFDTLSPEERGRFVNYMIETGGMGRTSCYARFRTFNFAPWEMRGLLALEQLYLERLKGEAVPKENAPA